jgi:hypothetical protein
MRRAGLALAGILIAFTWRPAAFDQAPLLDQASRASVVDALSRELQRAYVFPDKAAAMERQLRANLADHKYDTIDSAAAFARALTADLQAITRDKHLRVTDGVRGPGPGAGRPSTFGEAKRLEGNIAYLEVRTFAESADDLREKAASVMGAAADAAALIIDLRANGGGRPETVALLSSYLFDDTAVHLNSLYWRVPDRTDRFFTDPHVGGRKFGGTRPVYVLTSSRTFSGAEEFAYNLQALKRATIVGETTGGGAHPGGVVTLPHGLAVFVPTGRAINPITKTNWEGTGVRPDVAVSADTALEKALELARRATESAVRR